MPLNRDESLSVASKVLTLNNLEVDPPQHKEGQDLRVFAKVCVLNKRGKPLEPCSPCKARKLLKKGEAHVVENGLFFTIQLNKATGETVKKYSFGIDSGSKKIGFSVITKDEEIITGEVYLDQKTPERLISKSMYRGGRRDKMWYREARHNNRSNARTKGWLAPSIKRKFNTHINFINKLRLRFPINEEDITIEVGNFDIQKIENQKITKLEYQQGPMYEYQNMRIYLMAREKGKCQLCNKEFSKGNSSHIHHIIPRSKGGPNKQDNLALLHEKCHDKLHKNKLFDTLKRNKQYKDAAFMTIVQHIYKKILPNCKIVYGYETFVNRNELGLEKTHYNDAFVIAGGTNQIRINPTYFKQKHKNNRIIQLNRKGFKPSIRRHRYSIQPYDTVTINSKKYVVNGSHHCGRSVRCFNGINKIDFNIKKSVKKVFHTKSIFKLSIQYII
jgi:hypothetical protein